MLHGGIRTKEKQIILILLSIILLVTGVFVLNLYIGKKRYEEQTIIANDLLEAGNYEEAIEAYLKAMSMKKSNHELLAIDLAEAYSGIADYDKALEVLRNSYTRTGNLTVKEKIEEITARKTEYIFQQTITHADNYYTNGEYNKAIIEYEKAKSIKSREVITYKQIAEAYIALGDYNQAKEEALEGLALTQNDQLKDILDKVETYFIWVKYDDMLLSAQEYIVQGNYEEAINIYLEAIRLLPKEAEAYSRLSEVYIIEEQYEKAVSILESGLITIENNSLEEALERAVELKEGQERRIQLLEDLYTAVLSGKSSKILTLIEDPTFTENIAVSEPVYYNVSGEGNISTGRLMIIYNQNLIYAGDVKDGMKKGSGTAFMRLDYKEGKGWYLYKGEWNNDIPSGVGMTREEQPLKVENGITHNQRIVTEGVFLHGKENGQMKKTFFLDEQEIGTVTYWIANGIPQAIKDDGVIGIPSENSYAIGELYRNGRPTGEYYTVKQGTEWGVRGYVNK